MKKFLFCLSGHRCLVPLLVLGPALSCVVPKVMAALFIATAIFAVVSDSLARKSWPELNSPVAACLGAFVAYGAVSQFWTINPDETLMKAGQLGLLFGLTAMLVPIIRRLDQRGIESFGKMLVGGLALGLAVYGLEQSLGFPLYSLAHPAKVNAVADIKQSKAIVLLALWFYLSIPYLMALPLVRRVSAMIVVVLLLAGFTFVSASNSAKIFLIMASVWALIALYVPTKLTLPSVMAGIVGLTALMPAVASSFKGLLVNPYETSLPTSLLSRIEIWNQAASRIMEKPVFGWGLDASSLLPNRGEISVLYLDTPQPIAHLHPHNAPIQLWFELGGVGILIVTALFAMLYMKINALRSDRAKRFAIFLVPTTFLYTLTIWGIWQTWFAATLCFVGVAAYTGVRYLEEAQR